jgi:hypothetical protein
MPAIKKDHFTGGSFLAVGEENDVLGLASALRAGIDDITELRTQLIALLAKLDADAGVADTDYAATLTPAAQTLTKA